MDRRSGSLIYAWLGIVLALVPVRARSESPLLFTDVTAKAQINFRHTIGDDKLSNIVESSGVGCALLDFDGDGWLDIYLVNGMHLDGLSDPNVANKQPLRRASDRLYRNRGDGTFEDVTSKAGIQPGGYGMGVTVGDYDNDGHLDIYVTNYGPNRLYHNLGNRTFEEVAEAAGVADKRFGVGATFLDYDIDGDLDLYVGNYLKFDPSYKVFYAPDGFPGPTAYNPQTNRLYRNDGNGRFTDVTAGVGLDKHPGRTMGVNVFDYNDDGLPDIFVANDAMENQFLRNQDRVKFQDVALLSGVAYALNGDATGAMGAEVGDIDGDGKLDLFVPDFDFTCLYANRGDGTFEDMAYKAGIAVACGQFVSWGAVLADFDLDADLDLFVATGDAHHLEGHENVLLQNDGSGKFTDVSNDSGPSFRELRVARGVAAGDIDNDGDVDLLVVHLNDRPVLLRNDSPRPSRNWLSLKLNGAGNRSPLGARVHCNLPGRNGKKRMLVRELTSSGSYMSTHDSRAHFGLGKVSVVPEIQIRWPDGAIQRVSDVKPNQILKVQQPKGNN